MTYCIRNIRCAMELESNPQKWNNLQDYQCTELSIWMSRGSPCSPLGTDREGYMWSKTLEYHGLGVYIGHTTQRIQQHQPIMFNRRHVLTCEILIDKIRPMFHEKAKHGRASRTSLQPQQHRSTLWFYLHIETRISAKQ